MSKKNIIITTFALVFGVLLGGVIFKTVKASDVQDVNITRPFMKNLSQEERDQIQKNVQEIRDLHDKIERTVTKTDDGIQINLKGKDQDTINKMHELYDQNGGDWGHWGRMMRQGMMNSGI